MQLGFYVIPIVIGIIFCFVFIYWRNPWNSPRLRWTATRVLIRFLENYGGNFVVVDWALVPLTMDHYDRNKRRYIIDMQRAIFDEKGRGYLYYDIDSALPMTTEHQFTDGITIHKVEAGERVIKATPSGDPVVTVRPGEEGKPQLWFDPSYVDANLFQVRSKATVWSQILSGVFQKFALYIIAGLIIAVVAVAAVSMWQINNLSGQLADVSRRLMELLAAQGGGVSGG
jgi:hypothetical protein